MKDKKLEIRDFGLAGFLFLRVCVCAWCLCVLRRNAAERFVGTKQLKSTEKLVLSEKEGRGRKGSGSPSVSGNRLKSGPASLF